jgi:hypothetical protein
MPPECNTSACLLKRSSGEIVPKTIAIQTIEHPQRSMKKRRIVKMRR